MSFAVKFELEDKTSQDQAFLKDAGDDDDEQRQRLGNITAVRSVAMCNPSYLVSISGTVVLPCHGARPVVIERADLF